MRSLGIIVTLCAGLTSAIPAASAVGPASGLALSFGPQAVLATGLTPGGQVVWFSLAKEVEDYDPTFVHRQDLAIADAAGQASFPLGKKVPLQSIWVAVDLATGAYALASPPGYQARVLALPAAALHGGGAALADRLEDITDAADLLVVRPGLGAWTASVGRGGPADESSPADRALKVSLEKLQPLGKTALPALGKLALKDLLVVVHPQAMAVAVIKIEVLP